MARVKTYATSTDVARLAQVSQSAVSRAFRPGTSVSSEMRRKIVDASEQLGYRPSLIPRIMSSGRSHLVAIVVGGLDNPFYASVLERLARQLQATGHQPLLLHVESAEALDEVLPRLAGYRVDAIVSALAVVSPAAARGLAALGIPVVSFNSGHTGTAISSVSADNAAAGRSVAALFAAGGAKRLAFVSGGARNPASAARLRGFQAQARDLGLPPVGCVHAEFHYDAGLAAASTMMAAGLPDAVFCANDLIAIGLLDGLRHRHGVRVPGDVEVVGFDDIPEASWESYALTTVRQDGEAMVAAAMALLKPGQGTRQVVALTTLVERATTRPRPLTPRPKSARRTPAFAPK